MFLLIEESGTADSGLLVYGRMILEGGALVLLGWILRALFTRVPIMVDTMAKAHTDAVTKIADSHTAACKALAEAHDKAVQTFRDECRDTRSMFRQEQDTARGAERGNQEAARALALTLAAAERTACEARQARLETMINGQGTTLGKLELAVTRLAEALEKMQPGSAPGSAPGSVPGLRAG